MSKKRYYKKDHRDCCCCGWIGYSKINMRKWLGKKYATHDEES